LSNYSRLIFILLLTVATLSAQITIRGQSQAYNLQSEFTKQHTSWLWHDNFSGVHRSQNALSWQLFESFNSQVILPGSITSQWKDDQKLQALIYYNSNRYQWGWYVNSWLQSDKHTDRLNTFYNHASGLFTKIDIGKGLALSPYVGYQFSRNVSQHDTGWDIGIDGHLRQTGSGSYRSEIDFSSNYDFYDTRQNYNNRAVASFSSKFSAFSSDSLSIGYEESIKQFYDNQGKNLINVSLYNRNFNNMLFYTIGHRSNFVLQTQVLSKNVSFFNKRRNFLIGNRIAYNYFGTQLQYRLDFRTNDETLDTDGIRTDSRTRQSAFGFTSSYKFNVENRLQVNLSYIKLQYDTPDSVFNNDDRDEQTYILNLNYYHRFSRALVLNINSYGYLFHQQYIYREQSINNLWNRIIKLEPSISYRNKNIINRVSSSVIANYTDYDFDNLSLRTRSFLFRKYTISDSLSYNVTNRTGISVRGRVEIEEKGNYFKDNFSQNLIQTYQTAYLTIYLSQKFYKRLVTQIGFAHFKRSEWRYIPKKKKNRELSNNGPFFRIYYNFPGRLSFNASANLNRLEDSQTRLQFFTTGAMRLNYSF